MGIKRYIATKDSTITNAFKLDLSTRATSSNMGEADVTEVFSIYAQSTTSSVEKSRALYEFPVKNIASDRSSQDIPASGSVSFFLRLFNARHSLTLPRRATYAILPISQSWDEGYGLDMESYLDTGSCSWVDRNSGDTWVTEGGTFHTASEYLYANYSTTLERGDEDIEVDITELVERWMVGTTGSAIFEPGKSTDAGFPNNNGVVVKLSGAVGGGTTDNDDFEDGSTGRSYYTKKFFARGTEFFFKKPCIEARWDSSRKDNTGNFVLSSSLLDKNDNINTLYLYNYFRGQLRDIPEDTLKSTTQIRLALFSGSNPYSESPAGDDPISLPIGGGVAANDHMYVTGSRVSTGVYSASFAYTSSGITKVWPVWYNAPTDGPNTLFTIATGSLIEVDNHQALPYDYNTKFISKITNLKPIYTTDETARLRLFTRAKNYSPNVYSVAVSEPQNHIIENAFYKITRVADKREIIPFGTGASGPSNIDLITGHGSALDYTRLSYDVSGNYFDFDMSLLEPGYLYSIKLAYYLNDQYKEQKEQFNFRVEVDE